MDFVIHRNVIDISETEHKTLFSNHKGCALKRTASPIGSEWKGFNRIFHS